MILNMYTDKTDFKSIHISNLNEVEREVFRYCKKYKISTCKFSIRGYSAINMQNNKSTWLK